MSEAGFLFTMGLAGDKIAGVTEWILSLTPLPACS